MLVQTFKLYEDREDVTLTAYVLDDSTELLNGKRRPAVLICPGGAYLACSDREAEPVALRFASMGYHAFVLRYSTYLEAEEPFEMIFQGIEKRERTVFPTAMHEIGKSLLLIREHASEWLVDSERIALCGFSAGAHNVATYAVYWNQPIVTDYFNASPQELCPTVAILGYPITDYVYMKETKMDERGAQLFKAANVSLLGEEVPNDQKLEQVSPARHVTSDTPPMFIWGTAADSLVPIGHSTRMATALADHEIPFELHIFEEGVHGLSLATQATASSLTLIDEHAEKWINLVEKWLEKRFKLEIE